MNDCQKNAMSAELEYLIGEEARARKDYYLYLTKFDSLLSEEDLSKFKEIISEELKHSKMLSEMVTRISEILPE